MDKYFDILGLKPGATKKEIKEAYHQLAKVWHPDRFPKDDERRVIAQEKMKLINEAYNHLRHIRFLPMSQEPGAAPPHPGYSEPPPSEPPPHPFRWPVGAIVTGLIGATVLGGYIVSTQFADDGDAHLPVKPAEQISQPELNARDFFTIGSTKEHVFAIQGSPAESTEYTWWYGYSRVTFEGGRVTNWYISNLNPLRARMLPSSPIEKSFFSIGSTKDEVLSAQGTPSEFNERTWTFGYSKVNFENGRVISWYDSPVSPLKIASNSSPDTGQKSIGSDEDGL